MRSTNSVRLPDIKVTYASRAPTDHHGVVMEPYHADGGLAWRSRQPHKDSGQLGDQPRECLRAQDGRNGSASARIRRCLINGRLRQDAGMSIILQQR